MRMQHMGANVTETPDWRGNVDRPGASPRSIEALISTAHGCSAPTRLSVRVIRTLEVLKSEKAFNRKRRCFSSRGGATTSPPPSVRPDRWRNGSCSPPARQGPRIGGNQRLQGNLHREVGGQGRPVHARVSRRDFWLLIHRATSSCGSPACLRHIWRCTVYA